ncbi:hypothetical protein FIBSPDRAFT_988309 [Athelia psychrophila]|uniref:Uncharacterized protein n=1 Tax=Athelia psychrophila TaxID=1759441 RepID=A0A166A732_9AGAM|nr:hypothetical protein FIBSPDRAFT_988309 [Fibularhizoctonia sp. CBS 109695]
MPCARISKSIISRPVAVEYADMVGSFAYTRQSLPPKAARNLQLPSFLPARHARKSNLQGSGEIATRPVLAPICAKSKSGEREMVCHLTAAKEVQWTATSGKGALANFNFKHDWCHLCHVQIVETIKLSGQGAQDRRRQRIQSTPNNRHRLTSKCSGRVDMNKNNREDDLDRMCELDAWLWADMYFSARKIVAGNIRRRLGMKMAELVHVLGFQFSNIQPASQETLAPQDFILVIGWQEMLQDQTDRIEDGYSRPQISYFYVKNKLGAGRTKDNSPTQCCRRQESSGSCIKALGCIRPDPFIGSTPISPELLRLGRFSPTLQINDCALGGQPGQGARKT